MVLAQQAPISALDQLRVGIRTHTQQLHGLLVSTTPTGRRLLASGRARIERGHLGSIPTQPLAPEQHQLVLAFAHASPRTFPAPAGLDPRGAFLELGGQDRKTPVPTSSPQSPL